MLLRVTSEEGVLDPCHNNDASFFSSGDLAASVHGHEALFFLPQTWRNTSAMRESFARLNQTDKGNSGLSFVASPFVVGT
jgi:hypothetical protein